MGHSPTNTSAWIWPIAGIATATALSIAWLGAQKSHIDQPGQRLACPIKATGPRALQCDLVRELGITPEI
jgi:hypothetical protein